MDKPAPTAPTPHALYLAAQRLETHDRAAAARAYRVIANGNDSWAALALYSFAQMQASQLHDTALAALDEYQRRFPHGANAEDAAWLRVDVLRAAGRQPELGAAARAYLAAFPAGTYATAAGRLADAKP